MTPDLTLPRLASTAPNAGAARAPAATVPLAAEVSPAQAVPNPRLRLDGALGMVVIEFRDTAGKVAGSIPTPREIEAYRAVARGGDPLAPRAEAETA